MSSCERVTNLLSSLIMVSCWGREGRDFALLYYVLFLRTDPRSLQCHFWYRLHAQIVRPGLCIKGHLQLLYFEIK